MHRISTLQSLFDAARLNIQCGNTNLEVKPIYLSIFDNRPVQSDSSTIRSIAGNPIRIGVCTISLYQAFGRPSSIYYKIELHAYINQSGEILNNLTLSNWTLESVIFGDELIVQEFTIQLNDNVNERFVFTMMDFQFISQEKIDFNDVWLFINEIDSTCKTANEAEIYTKFLIKRKEANSNLKTVDDYKQQLEEQKDLIGQHESLLRKIQSLVAQVSN
jgi:hypothetical protein